MCQAAFLPEYSDVSKKKKKDKITSFKTEGPMVCSGSGEKMPGNTHRSQFQAARKK